MADFLFRQPPYPKPDPADKFYLDVANSLLGIIGGSALAKSVPEEITRRIALGLTGYFQDIVSDAGIWRSFVDANRKLYGYSVPFHEEGEEYVDYELNAEDVRFLTWYILAMTYEDMRETYPHDPRVMDAAELSFSYLESIYEEAPASQRYNIARGLEFNDPDDREAIYILGSWLFFHCYLMTPAFALALSGIMSDPAMMESDDVTLLHSRMDKSMMEEPTGPLALFVTEWLRLIIDGVLPENKKPDKGIHPYYERFTLATGGRRVMYFGNYGEMNDFFIEKMGWEKDQEHLPMMKSEHNFVVMVNPERGMLVARNAALCIADPANPYYDRRYAEKHAFDFLTVRGRCPVDLVKYACDNGWLPDAVFPGTTDTRIVADHYDFIARCYLQQYYRD